MVPPLMIITIDGPSGTGKSTVAKSVAEKLKMVYFDTGAMYRAFTLVLLNKEIPFSDSSRIEEELEKFSFDIEMMEGKKRYFIDGTEVTEEIRTQKITENVSEISAMKKVRDTLTKMQRSYAQKQGAVFEGRDLGSVVFPDAEVKIFLDASAEVRAKRRLKEMKEKMPHEAAAFDEKKMEQDLLRRDAYDSGRKIAPLVCPKGALRIDTSDLTIDQVVERIAQYYCVQVKKLIPAWRHSKQMHFLYRFILFLAWGAFKLFYRHRVYGVEHFIRGSAIIAPNHTSYLDPPVAAISWPEEVHFLARESLFKPFLFGPFIRALNAHPVSGEVTDISVFKTIIELLKEGKQLVLFPEGARTEGQLEKIKPGIGMLAIRSKAAIIPTYIHGTYEIWGRHRKLPKLFGRTVCVFGAPIHWETFANLDKKEAQAKIAEELTRSIHALKNWYESGAIGTPP
ncbi:MAG: (d)CMP kinase [Verrucomicrobia bacterium]|nr:(d)CMP kinase [Verrucomicrobiota bacterium]